MKKALFLLLLCSTLLNQPTKANEPGSFNLSRLPKGSLILMESNLPETLFKVIGTSVHQEHQLLIRVPENCLSPHLTYNIHLTDLLLLSNEDQFPILIENKSRTTLLDLRFTIDGTCSIIGNNQSVVCITDQTLGNINISFQTSKEGSLLLNTTPCDTSSSPAILNESRGNKPGEEELNQKVMVHWAIEQNSQGSALINSTPFPLEQAFTEALSNPNLTLSLSTGEITHVGSPQTTKATIWPNPATDYLFLHIPQPTLPSLITIINSTGQIIQTLIPTTHDITMPIKGLSSGLYLLCVGKQTYKVRIQ